MSAAGPTKQVRVFVSLGSNVEREHNIGSALTALRNRFGPLELSSVYESEAVGFAGAPFLNLVARFETDVAPEQVTRVLRDIEAQHGRDRSEPRYSARTLDIDLLLYGDMVADAGGLELPRYEITTRAFVLCPLAELAGEQEHPVLGKSYAELWQAFDATTQRLWRLGFSIDDESGSVCSVRRSGT